MIDYKITNDSLHIDESYKVNTIYAMESIIKDIKIDNSLENYEILSRTTDSFVDEWAAHNLLYNLHIMRIHTAEVDFEYPQKWYYSLCYWILRQIYSISH